MPEVLEETDQQRRLRVTRPDTATLDKNSGLVRLPACVFHDLLWHNLNVEAPSTDLVALHTALTYWHIAAKLQGGAKPERRMASAAVSPIYRQEFLNRSGANSV